MPDRVILIRQSSNMRKISEGEAIAALPQNLVALRRKDFHLDMSHLASAVEQGDWGGHDRYIREQVGRIQEEAGGNGVTTIHYFGLAEVPHILAVGAHMGRAYTVRAHDFNSLTNQWGLTEDATGIELVTIGGDSLVSTIPAYGAAAIRVSISAYISDSDVEVAVGANLLANVTLTLASHISPRVGLIRSQADVDAIRLGFRQLFARVRNSRPNLEVIHLFVAAPPSVCIAIGQELALENSPAIQTYRYRKSSGGGSQQAAILLRPASDGGALAPLTPAEVVIAANVRKIWVEALREVESYVRNMSTNDTQDAEDPWYVQLQPRMPLRQVAPFAELPKVTKVVPKQSSVSMTPYEGEYNFVPHKCEWQLGDRLLLGLNRATQENTDDLRHLIRLFLFHEYVHRPHGLTKYSAEEVGKFANCLEYIDYSADVYALLHQLDLLRYKNPEIVETVNSLRAYFLRQIDLVIRSFWAFDEEMGSEWQLRRLRRYFNWYWRLVQVENAETELELMYLFGRPPKVEIAGLSMFARQRRVFVWLEKQDPTTELELAIVAEGEKLIRISPSPSVNLRELLSSFKNKQHRDIVEIFRHIYDSAKQFGGVQVNTRKMELASKWQNMK